MIVKIEFEDGHVMLFGDSYKPWHMQADEYIWWCKNDIAKIKAVYQSKSKWIGWGGLKWCNESSFQEQLNREGCQSNEYDNPNPRNYNHMEFTKATSRVFNKVNDIYQNAKRSVNKEVQK